MKTLRHFQMGRYDEWRSKVSDILSENLLIVNAPIKSMITVSLGDNGRCDEWSHFPPSSAGCGFKDCNNIHSSGEKGSHLLPHSVWGPIMSQSCYNW